MMYLKQTIMTDRINPPSFYEKESDYLNENELVEKIKSLNAKQDAKLNLAHELCKVWHKAKERINWIQRSKAITYEVCGGYFARQKDLLKAESSFNWIDSNITRLEKEGEDLGLEITEYEYQLNRL